MGTESDIRYIKGVGEKRAVILNNHGITDVDALLRYYPRKYLDFKNTVSIYNANIEETCCIKAKVITEISEHRIRKNTVLYKFSVSDNTGILDITVWNNKYIYNTVFLGGEYLFYGKITSGYFNKQLSAPIIKSTKNEAIIPQYTKIESITSANLEKIIKNALTQFSPEETLPENILKKYNLLNLKDALCQIHFPNCQLQIINARKRLAFEELLTLQLGMSLRKNLNKIKKGILINRNYSNEFELQLPFNLTNAQKRVIEECTLDMQSGKPMARLVQGDVGSGKTVVAASLMFTIFKNKIQSVFMAPTEILAEQHFKTLSTFFKDCNINLALLTSSVTKKNKQAIKKDLSEGKIDILIGTHAVIEEDVVFKNLGLVITDEQHRFGVKQRTVLTEKGENPHLLVMSATPIPRTLALIIYGELDISIIDELPKGRQPIETYFVNSSYRKRIYNYLKKHLDNDKQAYIVCPLVSQAETETDIVSAEEYAKTLKENEFKNYSVGLIHGKMKPLEKDRIMKDFKLNKINILIATTVIEVGIDVKNATVMVIENAERFGLSSLHQLRGRIGRGDDKSTCILISDTKSKASIERLNIIKETTDGFLIADKDLKLRGPGDFCGKRQHGLPELKIADLETDLELFKLSVKVANEILSDNKQLENYPTLLNQVKKLYNSTKQYGQN